METYEKYIGEEKFKYIDPKGINTFARLMFYVEDADSIPELKEWGKVAKKIEMSQGDRKHLKAMIKTKSKILLKVDTRG